MLLPGQGSFVTSDGPFGRTQLNADKGFAQASSERNGHHQVVIGLLIPDISPSYGLKLLDGICDAVDERGVLLLMQRTRGEYQAEERAIQQLVSAGVSGLLMFPVNGEHYNEELLRLHLTRFPLALIDHGLPGVSVPFVTTDNRLGTRQMVEHLFDLGHQRIGLISIPPDFTLSLEDRVSGYEEAMVDRGLAAYHDLESYIVI